jgi:sortase A
VVGGVGRVFVTVGILILLFVAYQLWGTGLYTDREQSRLRDEFNAALQKEHGSTPTTTPGSTPTTTTTTTPEPPPPSGDAVAQIRIPSIGVDSIVVNGIGRDDLRKGPGHYPDTPMPGQVGNAAIAGHRTTYGAPFGNLDQLAPGDEIITRTVQGTFRYHVYEQQIVSPNDVSVIDADPAHPASLTLTTCNPKYSASQRLVVKAELQNKQPLPAPPLPAHPKIAEAGLSGEQGSKVPTVLAGIIAAIVGALWWLFFHRHPRWTTWVLGAIPFAVALFFFYVFLERVLPANY